MATLRVFAKGEVVKDSGYSKLFQALMKLISPIVTIPGKVTGRRICQNILNNEAPSMMAASSISYGICLMKEIRVHTVKGARALLRIKVIPPIVSRRCKFFNVWYRGTI